MADIKQKTIKCSEEIIEWVKKQRPNEAPSKGAFVKGMGQYLDFTYLYCEKYTYCNCPLYTEKGCCNGLWEAMDDSSTWAEWIINAEKVLQYIKGN